jgi:EAL domain-containing protein (putative c-di-GMP-specific phosphodiesterase class I)/GGDEF domain-containing protein
VTTSSGGSRRPSRSAPRIPAVDPRRILSSIREVVYDWDLTSDRLRWGPNAVDVLTLDRSLDIETGKAWSALLAPESPSSRQEALARAPCADRGGGVNYHVTYAVRTGAEPSATVVWLDDTGRWFAGADGRPARAHGAIRVCARQDRRPKAEASPSPGMASLAQIYDRASSLIDAPGGAADPFGLMILSLDKTSVFEALPPAERDDVVGAAASRIADRMRRGDLIARFDETSLALLLEGGGAADMQVAFARFARTVSEQPVATTLGPLIVIARAGASIAPRGGYSGRDLFASALEALERARAQASPGLTLNDHSTRVSDRACEVRRLCDEARKALAEDRFQIALQPVVRAKDHTLGFCEALMRLRNADSLDITPAVLLPAAEQTGLIAHIDQRVIELSIRLLEAEPARVLSVNVSGATLHDPLWSRRIEAALAGRERCAQRMIFEITETCAIENLEATGRSLAHLRGLGARVAMDDFGAGHTSFRNLRSLDIDILKIDGAFIQNIVTSTDDQFFVRTLHDLARHLGIETVAEWVETMEAADMLTSWGVEYLQGAAFGLAQIPGEISGVAIKAARDAA